ncbi:hypothetical protein G5714_002534 [Onychostoma macrolepis]|uniref:Uncharacterized protein n=1 Tax=Onychostoma macrolepis TaxID=369639 RepID=A0A7J6D7N2_9TELE|nr:hypothetical protein G5714_002534 [Onychostoma macrolepis]
MNNITVSCGEIESAVGFVYVILSVILKKANNPDCDQSWYSEDGRLLADPSDPQTLMYPVISVSSDRLTTSYCVDELLHEIRCHALGFRLKTVFRVRNETDPNSGSTQTPNSHHLWWLLAFVSLFLS